MTVKIAEARAINVKEIIKNTEFAEIPGADDVLNECLYRSSVRCVAYADDVPACVWGLIPRSLLSDQAYLWVLTTEVAEEHKFLLARYSQLFVEHALKSYSVLYGHVDPKPTARRWLRWLGAEFGAIDPKNGKMMFQIKRR